MSASLYDEPMPKRALLALITLMLVCAASSIAAPTQSAAPSQKTLKRNFSGVDYAFYDRITKKDLSSMKRAKVRAARLVLYWHSAEPQHGVFKWSRSDALIGDLASRGIRSDVVLHDSPLWANGRVLGGIALDGQTRKTMPVGSPQAEGYWEDFLTQAVARYGPNGTFWSTVYQQRYPGRAPLPVNVWQIWNEPNIPGQSNGSPDVQGYGQLVKISAPAIRAVDPSATVALAGLPGKVDYPGTLFLSQLYKIPHIAKDFDLVAVHPYASSIPQVRQVLKSFRHVMLTNHDKQTGIWVSEIGWGSAPKDGHLNKGKDGQARYLKRTIRLLWLHRMKWNITKMSWFNWRDPDHYPGPCTWCPTAGLFTNDDQAKPSYDAYRSAINSLAVKRH
jgi:polysaccharide biosynthesis protein PslG